MELRPSCVWKQKMLKQVLKLMYVLNNSVYIDRFFNISKWLWRVNTHQGCKDGNNSAPRAAVLQMQGPHCLLRGRCHKEREERLPGLGVPVLLVADSASGKPSRLHCVPNVRGMKFCPLEKDNNCSISSCSPQSEMDLVPTLGIDSDDMWD